MPNSVELVELNASHHAMRCDDDVFMDAYSEFTFKVPGHRFMPAYRRGTWDGTVKTLKRKGRLVPSGLVPRVERYLLDRGDCAVTIESKQLPGCRVPEEPIEFVSKIDVPTSFERRDYQLETVRHAMANTRALILSPTGSGKSMVIYVIGRWYGFLSKLLIVPTKALVNQMVGDFRSYGYREPITTIHGEADKSWRDGTVTEFTISTWQSVYDMPADWFERYGVLLGDEAHGFKSKSLVTIGDKCRNAYRRYGFTGTLDGKDCHQMVLEGVFGRVYEATKTIELQKRNQLAKLEVRIILLRHPLKETISCDFGDDYMAEAKYLAQHQARREFTLNLLESLKGNTLLLFQYVKVHGEPLHRMALDRGLPVHFISGSSKVADREAIRELAKERDDLRVMASYGTFAQGVNIPRLDNIILASSYRSEIKVLQSIGRGLRVGGSQGVTRVYDLADDLRHPSRKKPNFSYRHMKVRIGYYNREQFPYRTTRVDL